MYNQQIVQYPNGWKRTGNIFSYDHDWQIPAKTELWAYEKLISGDDNELSNQYICFPWATLIDYLDHNPQKSTKLLHALANKPPKMALKVVTYCQHIYALKLLPYFKALGITDIYWSHKIKGQCEAEGIKLHPYPLYPVMHYKRIKPYRNKPLKERKHLYSFIGAYQPGLYMTEVRKWIFNLPKRDDAIIIERSEWHFEQDIYRNQLHGESEAEAKQKVREQHEKEYIEVMEDTVFCLCPSGSGPNSIRLWEAIEFGCIPVLISSQLELTKKLNCKYKFLELLEKEEVIKNLPSFLSNARNDWFL
ncbi:exostosin domain-containing protein [Thalassotalea eurytherma]|uniref:Exostosin GT47 domain-containing protein n=1 Tax=Thalassotalea eurytherma TaxID=1144278 RepID=A0ABQ6GZK5_9GAMM|nr:exostosin family protein [Thalassotalea eurytherma]GLX81297.1 hypothetical protein theurythT_07490 [Thalassotalea eurytherma]